MAGSEPYWDEDGVYHIHDINTRTTLYKCSASHEFMGKGKPACPAGDYGGEELIRKVK